MVMNLGVRELGLLDCCVEEMDERMGEGEQQEVCEMVEEVLREVEVEGKR